MNRRTFAQSVAAAVALAASRGWAAPASTSDPRLILYAGNPSAAMVETLGPSRFNHVILAFVYARHRMGRLQLSLNGIAPEHAASLFAPRLRRLRSGFSTRKRILVSLGGWGNIPTFAAIRAAGVENFLDTFDRELVVPLGLEGIDLDLEPSTVAENTPTGWHAVHDEYGATLVALTRGYHARHPHHVVTHAPISGVAASLYARDGGLHGVRGSLFDACGGALSWINIQFYEAGDPKPLAIPDFCRRQLASLTTDRWVPGFEPRYHQDLAFCETTLHSLPGVSGTFLWDYRQVAAQLPQWSSGLRAAMAPQDKGSTFRYK